MGRFGGGLDSSGILVGELSNIWMCAVLFEDSCPRENESSERDIWHGWGCGESAVRVGVCLGEDTTIIGEDMSLIERFEDFWQDVDLNCESESVRSGNLVKSWMGEVSFI